MPASAETPTDKAAAVVETGPEPLIMSEGPIVAAAGDVLPEGEVHSVRVTSDLKENVAAPAGAPIAVTTTA